MGWIIRYARIGNADPIYSAHVNGDPDVFLLSSSVKELAAKISRPLKSVRVACAEARDEGVSHFLD